MHGTTPREQFELTEDLDERLSAVENQMNGMLTRVTELENSALVSDADRVRQLGVKYQEVHDLLVSVMYDLNELRTRGD